MRLIVLIVLVVLAVWLIRRAWRRSTQKDVLRKGTEGRPAGGSADLVRCAHCGLHLPRAEARQGEGALYCSEEHARLGRR